MRRVHFRIITDNPVFSQLLHTAAVKSIKVRGHSLTSEQEVLVVYEDAVVIRLDGTSLVTLLQVRPQAFDSYHSAASVQNFCVLEPFLHISLFH